MKSPKSGLRWRNADLGNGGKGGKTCAKARCKAMLTSFIWRHSGTVFIKMMWYDIWRINGTIGSCWQELMSHEHCDMQLLYEHESRRSQAWCPKHKWKRTQHNTSRMFQTRCLFLIGSLNHFCIIAWYEEKEQLLRDQQCLKDEIASLKIQLQGGRPRWYRVAGG